MIFPVRERPVRGARGWHRRSMRHGVSRIRSGLRFTLGIIFHDALWTAGLPARAADPGHAAARVGEFARRR